MSTGLDEGEFPSGWESLSLSDVCLNVSKIDPLDLGRNEFKYIDIGSIDSSTNSVGSPQLLKVEDAPGRARQLVRSGDSVFSTVRPYLRNIAYVDENLDGEIASTGFCVLRPNPSKVLPRFIRFFSISDNLLEQVLPLQRGVSYPAVRDKEVLSTKILVPPQDEQEKIIEILEEQLSRLDAALASVQAVRTKAARFRRSLLNSIFEIQFQKYGDSSIEEMLEILPSGRKLDQGWSPQCLRQSVESNEDWGVLITTAVQHGSFNWKENKLLPATMAPRPAIELKNGDFLMTRLGPRPRCGVACMVRETRSQLMVPDKMYRFRPNQLVLEANFLNIFITSPQFLDAIEILKTGTSESGMNITQSRFLAVKVPRTPIGEQIKIASDIAAQLSRLEASLAIADAIEKKASALRRSLLHAAFSGNLTKEWREAAYV
jgi:type I restriction enzyme S subunit